MEGLPGERTLEGDPGASRANGTRQEPGQDCAQCCPQGGEGGCRREGREGHGASWTPGASWANRDQSVAPAALTGGSQSWAHPTPLPVAWCLRRRVGAEPRHSRDTRAFGRLSVSCAHCSEGETGAPKPPAQSHATREERSWDLSRLPVTAPPAPGAHGLAPAVGPPSDARSHPLCSPNSTCSCPRSVRGHAPRPPAPEAWSCPSPHLGCTPSGGQIRSAPPELSAAKEHSPLPVTPTRSARLTKAACTRSGLPGRKGRRGNPWASKLRVLWGRRQPQLFGAHCIPGTC